MIVPAMLLIYSFRFSTRPHNSGVLLRSFVTIIIQNVQSGVKRVFERCKSALISLLDRDKAVFITSLKSFFEQFYSPTLLRAIMLGFKATFHKI